MQKIILDTNVIVSALLSNGIPSQIINELVLERKVLVCISEEVLEEYFEVLARPKFSKIRGFKAKADLVLTVIDDIAEKYSPNLKIDLIQDASDNKFLELALASQADYLITGNTSDFTMERFEKTVVTTPRQYWDDFREEE